MSFFDEPGVFTPAMLREIEREIRESYAFPFEEFRRRARHRRLQPGDRWINGRLTPEREYEPRNPHRLPMSQDELRQNQHRLHWQHEAFCFDAAADFAGTWEEVTAYLKTRLEEK